MLVSQVEFFPAASGGRVARYILQAKKLWMVRATKLTNVVNVMCWLSNIYIVDGGIIVLQILTSCFSLGNSRTLSKKLMDATRLNVFEVARAAFFSKF